MISTIFEESPSRYLDSLFNRVERMDNEAYIDLATVAQLCEVQEHEYRVAVL